MLRSKTKRDYLSPRIIVIHLGLEDSILSDIRFDAKIQDYDEPEDGEVDYLF